MAHEIVAVVPADIPGFWAAFSNQGSSVFSGSPSDFGKLIAAETEKWAKVIKFANIKPE